MTCCKGKFGFLTSRFNLPRKCSKGNAKKTVYCTKSCNIISYMHKSMNVIHKLISASISSLSTLSVKSGHLPGCFFDALTWTFLWYGCLSGVAFGTPLSRLDLLMPTPSLTSAIALSMSSSDNFPYLAPGGRRRSRILIVVIFPSEKETTYHVILVHENYSPSISCCILVTKCSTDHNYFICQRDES